MDYFAGLDVSVKETSVCIVDDAGKIAREARVASEPEALLQVLTIYRFKRVGLEAGPLSQWLYGVLAEAGSPVICVETRHMRAMLKRRRRYAGQVGLEFIAALDLRHHVSIKLPARRLHHFLGRGAFDRSFQSGRASRSLSRYRRFISWRVFVGRAACLQPEGLAFFGYGPRSPCPSRPRRVFKLSATVRPPKPGRLACCRACWHRL